MTNDSIIAVQGVSKAYRLPPPSLSFSLTFVARPCRAKQGPFSTHRALCSADLTSLGFGIVMHP